MRTSNTMRPTTKNIADRIPKLPVPGEGKPTRGATDHVIASAATFTGSTRNLEILESPSLSILDESNNLLFDLMKKASGKNDVAFEISTPSDEQVNMVCALSRELFKGLRIKLDAIKVQRGL